MIYVGIDYSLSSPAVCVFNDTAGDFCFKNCTFTVITDKKIAHSLKNVFLYPHKPWTNPNERYHKIATELLMSIDIGFGYGNYRICIEDYSMGSRGKVFHIAENTQVLQYLLWTSGQPYFKIAPTVLKKFATGKGNSNKQQMYDAFVGQEGVDLIQTMGRKNCDSPVSDIIDAFFLCKNAFINTPV